jgi:3-phenylpropionate/cinnamic acid dioxygenase small subunit
MSNASEDRDEILQLLYRYCHYIDSHCFHDWVSLFTEDGVFEHRGRVTTGSNDLLKMIAATEHEVMRHLVSNPVIDITGDRARVHAYLTVMNGREVGSTGAYEDDLVRTEQGWRFARRVYIRDETPG